MATDKYIYGGSAFFEFVTTSDATTNGVEVVTAPSAGKSLFILGFMIRNLDSSAINIKLSEDAADAAHADIFPDIKLAADTGIYDLVLNPPLKVTAAKNFGIVADASGIIHIAVWGYTGAA